MGKLVAALAMLWFVAAARAEPPFITDEAVTQGEGHWQLELAGEHVHHKRNAQIDGATVSQLRQIALASSVLTYGWSERLDLAVTLNALRTSVEQDGTLQNKASGISDTILEAKWRFYDHDDTALAVKTSLSLPTGDENRGLGTGKASGGINFILTHEAGPWVLMANAAFILVRYKRAEDAQSGQSHLRRFSAAATYEVHEGWRLAAEIGQRTNESKDDPFLPGRNGSYAMLGAIRSPSKDADFSLGVRRAVSGGEYDWAFIAGATLRW
jgi:hypothetical protein